MATELEKTQKQPEPPKPEAPKQPEAPKTVKLTYLGSSHRLVDAQSGVTWETRGVTHTVSVEDAARLQALPYDQFEETE